MKSVLISIRQQWCSLIASGKKTVEIRKTKPKLSTPFKCYIYCTMSKKRTRIDELDKAFGGGMVIGEFVCDKVFDICIDMSNPDDFPGYPFPCTGLTDKEILQYLGNGNTGYGWHISQLRIYDTPKAVQSFRANNCCPYHREDGCAYPYHCYRAGNAERCVGNLTRPPQSWCYVEELP